MRAEEIHDHYDKNWSLAMRELHLGVNTYKYWITIGYIPMSTQKKIERVSDGIFIADCNDGENAE